MKLLFLTSYYPAFLKQFYLSNLDFGNFSYKQMLDKLLSVFFADTGAIYHYALKHNNNAFLIISNCEPLQKKWALENNVSFNDDYWEKEIALAQIKQFKPDVFYIESVFSYFGHFLKKARPFCKSIVAWISTPIGDNLKLNDIDLIVTSSMNFVNTFRNKGIRSEYMLPAFDVRVLEHLNSNKEKKIPFSFVGGWSDVHLNRKHALEQLVAETPIQLWGYGYKGNYSKFSIKYYRDLIMPLSSPILNVYNGEVWGLEMYNVLQSSLVTFNIHEELLKGHVGNMRMFEATGVGTMILNDDGINLAELFVPGKEIESYNSIEEAILKINYFIAHPDEAIMIGKNAQERTIKDYNYDNFILQLTWCLRKLLAEK